PSSSASAPAFSGSTTIAISYSATDGGSGVDSVELWARAPGETSFARVATDTTNAGNFSYTAAVGDGSYAFYTVAVDKAGNREDLPASGDAVTVLDTQAPSSSGTAPASTRSTGITVSYGAADSGSGVDNVELWAQAPGENGFAKVATGGDGSFTYDAAAGDG